MIHVPRVAAWAMVQDPYARLTGMHVLPFGGEWIGQHSSFYRDGLPGLADIIIELSGPL
jgi:hypothetical protein